MRIPFTYFINNMTPIPAITPASKQAMAKGGSMVQSKTPAPNASTEKPKVRPLQHIQPLPFCF
jgi:hypothetical protein